MNISEWFFISKISEYINWSNN